MNDSDNILRLFYLYKNLLHKFVMWIHLKSAYKLTQYGLGKLRKMTVVKLMAGFESGD